MNFAIGSPHQHARARIVTNLGDVRETTVKLHPAGELCGIRLSKPPDVLYRDKLNPLRLDHLTTDGVAVYLEE